MRLVRNYTSFGKKLHHTPLGEGISGLGITDVTDGALSDALLERVVGGGARAKKGVLRPGGEREDRSVCVCELNATLHARRKKSFSHADMREHGPHSAPPRAGP